MDADDHQGIQMLGKGCWPGIAYFLRAAAKTGTPKPYRRVIASLS